MCDALKQMILYLSSMRTFDEIKHFNVDALNFGGVRYGRGKKKVSENCSYP